MHGQVDDEVSGPPRATSTERLTPPTASPEVPAARPAMPTLVRLTSSDARVPDGEPLALAAQVRTTRTTRGAGPAASGLVEFRIGPTLVGRATLDGSGLAVLDGIHLPAGVHAVTATYLGDADHAAATSPSLPQAVAVHLSPVVLLVAPPSRVPDGVQLEAELLDASTGRLAEDATGPLAFSADGVVVAEVDLVAGHARAVVSDLPSGRLRAWFAGDAEHASASGSVLGAGS